MRISTSLCFLSAALLAGACGRSSSGNPDAKPTPDSAANAPDASEIDASVPDASAPDAVVDASVPDASVPDGKVTGPTTRIYVAGDFITNNTTQLGAFVAETATAPPLTLTPFPANGQLAADTAWAVSPDGTKLVYAADSTTTKQYDLLIADADGANPAVIVAGGAGQTITNITWSPDGKLLAFRWDGVATGQFEVYMIRAAAASTPTRLSPDRANPALDAGGQFDWSADSKYLAFTGDFTTDGKVELWAVDVEASTPTAVKLIADTDINAAAAPRGVIQPGPKFTAGGKVIVEAVLNAANDRHIYVADPTVAGFAPLASTALTRTDASAAEAHMFALSADRTKIVFAADGLIATGFEIYAGNADGTGTATRLTDGTIAAGREPTKFEDMVFSPDGASVAMSADFGATDEKYEPWVVALAGGAHRAAAIGGADDKQDASKVAWNRGGTQLYFVADATTDNVFQLYSADPAKTDQTPAPLVDVPTSGDVSGLAAAAMP